MAEKGVATELGFQGLLVAPHKESFSPLCLQSHKLIDTDSHFPLQVAAARPKHAVTCNTTLPGACP